MQKIEKIEISAKTIVFTVLFLLSLQLVWLLRDLIFSLFIAFIIMGALKPFVNFLSVKKVPKFISVFLVYIVFVGVFLELLNIIFPPLINESAALIKNFPKIMESLSLKRFQFIDLNPVIQFLPNITGQFFDLAKGVFSNTVLVITTLFFGFYFLLEHELVKKTIIGFFDKKKAERVDFIITKVEKQMSHWFWGELTLMVVVGVLTFIGLNLIGIRYALPLAVLAGLLEAVPNIGPVISAIPMVLIGFSQNNFSGFAALALAFIVQQAENNLIVPLVMKKVVGVNPIITLIALIVGGRLAGIVGVFLAIPVTLFVGTILGEIAQKQPEKVEKEGFLR